jgi:hypothetical protein
MPAMSTIRSTKSGLLIPSAWLKGWGQTVSVRRSADVVIIESPAREAVRKRLIRMVRKLRKGARALPPLTPGDITAEVNAVRRQRAGRN